MIIAQNIAKIHGMLRKIPPRPARKLIHTAIMARQAERCANHVNTIVKEVAHLLLSGGAENRYRKPVARLVIYKLDGYAFRTSELEIVNDHTNTLTASRPHTGTHDTLLKL